MSKNTKETFYDWCVRKNQMELLDLWDYKLNKLQPKDVYAFDRDGCYYFKCEKNNNHKSELYKIRSITEYVGTHNCFHLDCKQCKSFAQWGIDTFGENFIGEYWDIEKNHINPYSITKSARVKVWIINQKTYVSELVGVEVFKARYMRHKKNNTEDSFWQIERKTLADTYPEILNIWSEKNTFSPYEVTIGSECEIWLKCKKNIHNDYKRASHNYGYNKGKSIMCPECVKLQKDSKLQLKVSNYINEKYNMYSLLHEYNCNLKPINPLTSMILPFDNEIPELKLIIEVHGIQHYEIAGWHMTQAKVSKRTPEQEFQYLKWKDEYKKEYVLNSGYTYLVIPYWDEKNDNYKNVIDNCINQLTNQNNMK